MAVAIGDCSIFGEVVRALSSICPEDGSEFGFPACGEILEHGMGADWVAVAVASWGPRSPGLSRSVDAPAVGTTRMVSFVDI